MKTRVNAGFLYSASCFNSLLGKTNVHDDFKRLLVRHLLLKRLLDLVYFSESLKKHRFLTTSVQFSGLFFHDLAPKLQQLIGNQVVVNF